MQALPDDIDQLKQLLTESREALAAAEYELRARDRQIEALKLQIAKLKRLRFGRSPERLEAQIAQLELELGALEGGGSVPASALRAVSPRRASVRRPFQLRSNTRGLGSVS